MKIRLLVACLTLSFALVGSDLTAKDTSPASPLLAGTAKVDITPSEAVAVDILGQPLRVRDSLYARVIVLKDATQSIAIVSVDSLVFASPKVIAEAKAKWGVSHVVLSSTHTHSGMVPRGMIIKPPAAVDWTRSAKAPAETIDWNGFSKDPWYAATEEKIVAAIGKAMQTVFPARIVVGKRPFVSAYMAHNRRLVRDGKAVALWENLDRRATEPIDPTIGVIRIEDAAGKTRAMAVHYACHPVAMMNAGILSRDFPGALVDHIEQQLGPDCMAMYLQGAQGDLNPYDLHSLRGENRMNISHQSGISLAKGALKVAAELKAATQNSTDQKGPQILVKESLLTIPNRHGKHTTDVGLLTVVINRDLALVTIPGEPFIQHQLDLTEKSPVPNTFILGLAYYGKGTPFVVYIPTVRAVREGGYGATECSFLAPEAGEKMVHEAVLQLEEFVRVP